MKTLDMLMFITCSAIVSLILFAVFITLLASPPLNDTILFSIGSLDVTGMRLAIGLIVFVLVSLGIAIWRLW